MADLGRAATRKFHALKSTLMRLFKRNNPRIQPYQTERCRLFADAQRNERGDTVVSDRTQSRTEFVTEESFTCTDVLEVWFAGCHSGQFKFHRLIFVNCSGSFQTLVGEMFRMMLRCLLHRSRCIGWWNRSYNLNVESSSTATNSHASVSLSCHIPRRYYQILISMTLTSLPLKFK